MNTSMQIFIVTSSGNMSGGTRQALYQARGLLERGFWAMSRRYARPRARSSGYDKSACRTAMTGRMGMACLTGKTGLE